MAIFNQQEQRVSGDQLNIGGNCVFRDGKIHAQPTGKCSDNVAIIALLRKANDGAWKGSWKLAKVNANKALRLLEKKKKGSGGAVFDQRGQMVGGKQLQVNVSGDFSIDEAICLVNSVLAHVDNKDSNGLRTCAGALINLLS